MYLICSASTCNSNHTTKVGSRSIKFYPYPNDEKLKHQWQKICKSTCTASATKDLFRLCELHFKESSFTEDMKLKSDAVPTTFNFRTKWKKETKVYPPARKRKPENQDDKNDRKVERKVYPPAKRRKPENQGDKNDTNTRLQLQSLYHPLSSDTKTYEEFHSSHRLLVQKDKMYSKSEWKSTQNIQESLTLSDEIKSTRNNLDISDQSTTLDNSCQKNLNESSQKSSDKSSLKNEESEILETSLETPEVLNICKNGCKLRNIIFSDSLAFMCENCGNIYIPQSMNITNIKQSKPSQTQVKNNLTCDICYSKFKSQSEYENHMKLHTCMNSETSFLCHICNTAFETKPIIRKHIFDTHIIGIKRRNQENFKQVVNLQCEICNLTFKDEETLRNHINSHEENNNSALPLKQSVKFACTVCSMEFTTSSEIDAHVKNHRKTSVKDRTCNICKKIFKNAQILNQHFQDHIARLPKCHLCSKAFVSESILKRHLESHV